MCFCEIFKNTSFAERLRVTTSEILNGIIGDFRDNGRGFSKVFGKKWKGFWCELMRSYDVS